MIFVANLALLIIILGGAARGVSRGVFPQTVTVIGRFIAGLVSVYFMLDLAGFIRGQFLPNEYYAKTVSIWILFIAVSIVISSLGTYLGMKFHISYPSIFNQVGGLICGVISATFFSSLLMLTLWAFTLQKEYSSYNFDREKILFRIDEFVPGLYSATGDFFHLTGFNTSEFVKELMPSAEESPKEKVPESPSNMMTNTIVGSSIGDRVENKIEEKAKMFIKFSDKKELKDLESK